MACTIIKNKLDGAEYLIPDCWGVVNAYYDKLTDREIIKTYCTCDRTKKLKYETKLRDEVFQIIGYLKAKIQKMENQIIDFKEQLGALEDEVFMLSNTETVDY